MPPTTPSESSSPTTFDSTEPRDVIRISLLTMTTAVISNLLLHALSSRVAPFDSSHLLGAYSSPGLRWDALHFTSIATDGYAYEQQLAFQPGWMGVLYALARVGGTAGALRGAVGVNIVVRVMANFALYKLTRRLFTRPLALIACILYAIPPAPAVLVAPYTEAPFACLFFSALYLSVTRRYLLSVVCFALGTSVRTTGVLGAFILAAHMVFRGNSDSSPQSLGVWIGRLPKAALYCVLIASPLVAFQAYAYYSLCPGRPWCEQRIPLVYSWVQREYWNVGPFRYWTPEQIPNFLLAAPVLWVSGKGCAQYLATQWRQYGNRVLGKIPGVSPLAAFGQMAAQPAFPIYVYQALMLVILVCASHTQIALRLSLTDPVLWWTLAAMFLNDDGSTRSPRWWVWWCLVWGAVSLVLWAGHYPPA